DELGVAYLLDLFSENRNGKIRLFSKEDAEAIEHSFLKIDQLNDLTHNYKHEALRKTMITGLLLRIDLSTVAIRDKGRIYKDEKIKIAEDVLTYIFKYYRDAIAIEDIANGLELSKSYISHVFKEMTGFSIMNYLMRYRLLASTKALLTEQTKSIKEIAYEHGFESDAHFSRFFKKNFGQTPNRFRKSYSL
ncbi:helix-turn-helix domain-containing protein, partial [Jeotgalibaca porci]